MNDFFDKIYVISLVTARERRIQIKEEAKKIGFDFEFYNAYDITHSKKYLKDISKTPLSIKSDTWWARVGCKISHINCLKDAIKNSYKRILVLEDDIIFRPEFKNVFNLYKDHLPDDWGITLLGYYIKNKTKVYNQNVSYQINDYIYTSTETHGAHCIAYNLESEDFLKYYNALTKKFLVEEHYDLEMHKVCNKLNIPRYLVYPQFVAQANGQSYISNREKFWDLEKNDPRYDLVESGTIYKDKYFFVKGANIEEGEYTILNKGTEQKVEYKNGYFVHNNKPLFDIIYYRK